MKDFGWNVAGVDFDPVAVEVAVSQGLEVALGSIKEQAYPEACFDAVVMSHLLEHVHDPFTVMNECFRILRPGGRVVVTTPNSAGAGLKQFGAAWRGLEQPRHLQIFTGAALGTLAKRSGFRKVDIWTSTRIARVIYLASTETAKAMQSGNSSRQLVIPLATPSTELYHFREILRSLWDRNAGDELIMICTK
jgi:ubiquinone/menaquinone biosynthesis C-methylase UbiE